MRHMIQLIGPGMLLTVLLGGCAAPAATPPISNPSAERPIAVEAPQRQEPPSFPADSLRVTLEFPAKVRLGEMVPFTLRVHNPTERPIYASIAGRPNSRNFDVVITTPSGVRVWDMVRHRLIDFVLSGHTFAPGEVFVLRDQWDQRDDAGKPVRPGTYHVRGALPISRSQDPRELPTEPKPLVIVR